MIHRDDRVATTIRFANATRSDGQFQFPGLINLNLRVGREFHGQGYRFAANLDLFNVPNLCSYQGFLSGWNQTYSTNYGLGDEVEPPRSVQLELRFRVPIERARAMVRKSAFLQVSTGLCLTLCCVIGAGWDGSVALRFPSDAQNRVPRVLIQTELGDIEVELEPSRAPVTVANFLKYVDGGYYDGGRFHRTVKPDNQPNNAVKIEVIQAEINPEQKPNFPPISLERTNQTGLSHKDGVISMGRGAPDSARWGFFICIGDQPELDFGGRRNPDDQGFAAFGRVVRGTDVVKKIQMAPAEAQRLAPPIKILSITRVR